MHWDIRRQYVVLFSLYEICFWMHTFADDIKADNEELQIVNFSVSMFFCLGNQKLIQFNNIKHLCL